MMMRRCSALTSRLVRRTMATSFSRSRLGRCALTRRGFAVLQSAPKSAVEDHNDKLLFTPGPLTTSPTVKHAMQWDFGSRDVAFIDAIKDVRGDLLELAGVSAEEYTTILVQGSGTFAVEAVLTSVVPRVPEGYEYGSEPVGEASVGVLIVANGAYGLRMVQMAEINRIPCRVLEYPDNEQPSLEDIDRVLGDNPGLTHVACVHSETTSGIVNHVEKVGEVVAKHNRSYFVDAMSSFGAVPVDVEAGKIDYLVSSANKCIEGVPGFAFAIARKDALESTRGNARVLSLDLHAQLDGLDGNGQFRFTPPTHTILAFRQAMAEHKAEGGVAGRGARYQLNHDIIKAGMTEMGFKLYLADEDQGPIISSYVYPKDAKWDFNTFYTKLNERGFVLYPGKVSKADCFRIGNIGYIFPDDCKRMLEAVREVVAEMGFDPSS
eukprot:TRINITY_DN66689_c3_g1_i1.p2 TRINITY_DN66689_c3_g1~~TRINITY_DN66689_c3_g1_i1.p2  ORF type:complete len:435 (+),score=240.11 TRINITY_DN66689_c3_g1_i1:84-1388(+)